MPKQKIHTLASALTLLEKEADAKRFLKDLLTLEEINEFEKRFTIAQLLWDGAMTYREIAKELSVSTTTVSRVARFLEKEPHQGYKHVLEKLNPKK